MILIVIDLRKTTITENKLIKVKVSLPDMVINGTYVDGIKEEVVLSPGDALSFIVAGEEHRHVGQNHFNLLSSCCHTIFTLLGMNFDVVTSESTTIHAFPFYSDKKQGAAELAASSSYMYTTPIIKELLT